MSTYKTISKDAEGLYKEKGSKFIAYASRVENEEEAKSFLERIKKEHNSARHHCYAYRFGASGDLYRANDDGEPGNTAGKPILGQLLSYEVSDVMLIVVRYFGGTKLGASGLITAYKSAAADALSHADIIEITEQTKFIVEFNYALTGDVMRFLSSVEGQIVDEEHGEKYELTFSVPLDDKNKVEKLWNSNHNLNTNCKLLNT
ncbi:MAG: YigZ family protein [Bacteroidia bacterium]|nr:YigZ family protein [Bacteroidia bacterium]